MLEIKELYVFTEAPLLSLTRMFKVFDKYPTPMYAAYGVAIKKDLVYELGGRPVIYGSNEEQKYLDPMIRWRFESFKPGEKDFTWLREWRLARPTLSLPADQVFFITKEKDLEILFDVANVDIDIDGDWADGQFHPYALGTAKRRYKGISIEELEQASNMSKAELELIIAKQDDSDSESFSMGRIGF